MAAETGCTSCALSGLERARSTANGITGWPRRAGPPAQLAAIHPRRCPSAEAGLAQSSGAECQSTIEAWRRAGELRPSRTDGDRAGTSVTPAPAGLPWRPATYLPPRGPGHGAPPITTHGSLL